jgi:DNA-binding FrmR family transcriptional regulator
MPYGYAPKKEQLKKRLSRAEGQVRGIAQMIENDKYCIDILTQVNAVQAALDKVALELLSEHTEYCLQNGGMNSWQRKHKAKELVNAVSRMLPH